MSYSAFHKLPTRTAHARMTARDWKIVGFGLSGIYFPDYVTTEGFADDEEIEIEYDLDVFAWAEIDRKIGEANDLGIIDLLDYDTHEAESDL